MQTEHTTIAALAGFAYDQFERKARDNGDGYVTLKDSAPEWLRDLVHTAHGDMLPDDWRYATIRAALGAIHDADAETIDDAYDLASEFGDGNVDTYTGGRLAWLSSHLSRAGYCDDAAAEFGYDPSTGIVDLIALGQYAESSEVFGLVVDGLAEQIGDES